MSPLRTSRRELCAGLALAASGTLAGCGGVFAEDEDETLTPEPYDDLRTERLFVADALSLSVPSPIETVDAPADADVVVLPATTERTAATAVGWITGGKRITLVGQAAENTWLAWQDSDAYAEAYPDHRGRAMSCSSSSSGGAGGGSGGGGGGSSGGSGDSDEPTDCDPPDLLVGWEPPEDVPTTYRKTWAGTDDPNGEQVFAGIDDAYEEW